MCILSLCSRWHGREKEIKDNEELECALDKKRDKISGDSAVLQMAWKKKGDKR